MTRRTAFFFDELCLWHAAGPHALTLPDTPNHRKPSAG
ncbi:hypothetical protein Q039_00524 [Pseudomonas aeruginosa BWHPSA026]|nr:hypothetical protein Q039_00524 [Pseudomonas aeruginosa BWHPSA026]